MSKDLTRKTTQRLVPSKYTFGGRMVVALPTILTIGASLIVWASAPLFALAIVAPIALTLGLFSSAWIHLAFLRSGFLEDYAVYVLYGGEYSYDRLHGMENVRKSHKRLRKVITYWSLIKGKYFRRNVSQLLRDKDGPTIGDREHIIYEITNGKPQIGRYEIKSASTLWKEGYRNALQL